MTSVYKRQTRAQQKRILRSGGHNHWIVSHYVPYGTDMVCVPTQWPYKGYLPHIPTGTTSHKARLMVLLMEIKSHFSSYEYVPLLLTDRAIERLSKELHVYQWPYLDIDKICPTCAMVHTIRYDEELLCC